MSLWTAKDAAAATGGEAHGNWSATGVSIDTRTLEPGDLFVALTAARDGHEFVAQALKKSAAAALVSHVPDGLAPDAPLLIVDDVQTGLEALGRAARERTKAKVAAITGSVGKTSTKEMLRDMFGDQGRVHASVASYNNHWGVPLTLARMPVDTEFAVIEIGMNHPGEIAPLSRLARPHAVMITTVGTAHLEAFGTIEGIADEKAAIMEGLEPGGQAILNADCSTAHILRETADRLGVGVIGFGQAADDFKLCELEQQAVATVARAQTATGAFLFKVSTPGAHHAMNGLGALAVVSAMGADLALAVQSLGRWQPYDGRGVREIITLDPVETHRTLELIDDSYNANPTSVAASLDILARADVHGRGRRIAILGDMKELGEDGPQLHRAIADLEAVESIDLFHCVGPLMQNLYDALPAHKRGLSVQTSDELADAVPKLVRQGDVVLAKGSLSMGLARIVKAVRQLDQKSETNQ